MKTQIFIKTTAAFTITTLAFMANATAQQQRANTEDEPLYADDISPGLHLHANESSGSVLAEAARSGGSVIISEDSFEDEYDQLAPQIDVYTVRPGDTLWDICTRTFDDPYEWPRIWSYNSQVTNPNWIYPGDVIWMSRPISDAFLARDQTDGGSGITPSGQVTSRLPSSIVLKNRGFVDKKTLEQSGELVGAHREVEMIGQFDEAYVEFKENEKVKPGDKLAAFVVLRDIDGIDDPGTEVGKLVEILGQVSVTSFDKESRIARVVTDESTREIKRGTLVGPITRKFNVIPAVSNDRNVEGNLIAILDPTVMAGTHQIVFVDRGREHGVRAGNRFFAVERRDNWRKSNDEDDDRESYPKEVIAEIRVVETRPQTSTCLITSSVRELEVGQSVEMRKGY